MPAVIAVLTVAVALGGCAQGNGSVADVGESSCPAVVEHDGHRYVGHGELKRTPQTNGWVGSGVVPACDAGNGADSASDVEVAELADIPRARAVLVSGQLYVRVDRPFPEAARTWFRAPSCSRAGQFELAGDWIDVQDTHRPRFDGDLRPPYGVGVHVIEGPEDYLGTTIVIRATARTDPPLRPDDVKNSLWEGGSLRATVQCAGGAFVANALTSSPG